MSRGTPPIYWSRVPSKLRCAVAAASRSGVGSLQYALVADHCGPMPLSCALAFWMMRLRIRSGARVAR